MAGACDCRHRKGPHRPRGNRLHAPGVRLLSLVAQSRHVIRLGARARRRRPRVRSPEIVLAPPGRAGRESLGSRLHQSRPGHASLAGPLSARGPWTVELNSRDLPGRGQPLGSRYRDLSASPSIRWAARTGCVLVPRPDNDRDLGPGPWSPLPPRPKALGWFALIGWIIIPWAALADRDRPAN
jgi:hypothetical protein